MGSWVLRWVGDGSGDGRAGYGRQLGDVCRGGWGKRERELVRGWRERESLWGRGREGFKSV